MARFFSLPKQNKNFLLPSLVSFKRGTVALTLTCVYISVRTHTHTHVLTGQGQSQKRLERVIFWWRVHTERVIESRGPQKNPFSARAFDSWCWLRVSCNFEENRFFFHVSLWAIVSLCNSGIQRKDGRFLREGIWKKRRNFTVNFNLPQRDTN